MEAAGLRNDVLLKRLQRANVGHFVYHFDNECYKAYTLSTTLRRMKKERSLSAEANASCTENSGVKDFKRARTRSLSSKRRPPPTNTLSKREQVCVVCGLLKNRGSFDNYRICEDTRADTFLKGTVFFQDKVYHRNCDLQDIAAVFGADLYCHKKCIKLYLLKYERAKTKHVNKDNSYISWKKIIFDELLSTIDPSLQIGHGYSVSDIHDEANEMLSEALDSFTNREIKLMLINDYKDNVKFTNPYEANKSIMVLLGNLSMKEIADKVRSIDIIKEAATKIINSLLDI